MRPPPPASPDDPGFVLSLHDVAPQTWGACARLLALVEQVASVPVTLLVVPNYHRDGVARCSPAYVDALHRRVLRGDELALHGWTHLDEVPLSGRPLDWLRRTRLTAGEAEFAALDRARAHRRIAAGLAWFEARRLPVAGFVPPAWQLGREGWSALREFGFRYTADARCLHLLPEATTVDLPSLVYSGRSGWRRALSRRVVELRARRSGRWHVLRLALHPVDLHPSLVPHWQGILAWLVAHRQPLTKLQVAELARVRAAAPSGVDTPPAPRGLPPAGGR